MGEVLIGIDAKLTKQGAEAIDLLVHSCYLGRPSPCAVVTDSVRHVIGGSIDSLEQIFAQELARHPGYIVKERANLLAIPACMLPTGFPRPSETSTVFG
jgi:hypothetical protein